MHGAGLSPCTPYPVTPGDHHRSSNAAAPLAVQGSDPRGPGGPYPPTPYVSSHRDVGPGIGTKSTPILA